MDTARRRDKIMEWVRRYLPLEIAGWIGELGGAAAGYWWTGSLAVAAVSATVGAFVGYYIPAYVNAVRWSLPMHRDLRFVARHGMANLLAARSLAVEFGPGEMVDNILRPVLLYGGPLLLGNVVWGWVVGAFLADVAFYVCAIFSYERFKSLLAVRQNLAPSDLQPALAMGAVLEAP